MIVEKVMSTEVHTVSFSKSVRYAAELMNSLKVGSLIVLDHEKVVGILTSRDIRNVNNNRIVADAMTPNPLFVSNASFIWEALDMMESNHIERLPVFNDAQELAGIVTRENVKAMIHQNIDPLTGMYRTEYIRSLANRCIAREERFTLLFIDLNNFGEINKQHGHPMGDKVLVLFSERLKKQLQKNEHACRYGGDEFLVFSPYGDGQVGELIDLIQEPLRYQGVELTAVAGVYRMGENAGNSLPFDEMVSIASIRSTTLKRL